MASNRATGVHCRANGDDDDDDPGQGSGSGSGRSGRHESECESDGGATVKNLSRLCSRDEEERNAALEELSLGVEACLNLNLDRPASSRMSRQTLLHLLRLSRSCPLPVVRERAAKLLRTAQVRTDLHF
ncbi:unnamed protein product [Ophioblennius macclurei]